VIDGQVGSGVGGTLVARAPVAALATPCAEHSDAKALPGLRAVQGVVPAAVRVACVLGAATARTAGDDTTDRAELHGPHRPCAVSDLTLVTLECTPVDIAMSVGETGARVYPPAVLSLGARLGSPFSPVEHLEPPVRPVAVRGLEGP